MCTWHQDALGRRSMIDFVVVSSDLRPHVLDTRVKRGAELSTDHHLVVRRRRWWRRMPDRPGGPKRIVRVCWESLAESAVRKSFNSHLRESFDHVPGEAWDIESEWTMFLDSIVEAADRCCGRKVVADRYRQAKRSAATAVAKAKTRAWEEFVGGPWEDPGHVGATVSRLVWERLGIPPGELEEVAGEREVWASLLRLLALRPDPG
ncbi:hypothetical protein D4764_12G0010750 [Takifugu flavidus]|uniref:Endonuclease/exonuclease/phosphatase domain-containing protein n=1 Tax=Takifugu flavidus TaxID=433684 RepID=A0A5C6PE68_9TELE|nr:hypothetical protein D4764_12G0010750 [Takifugu flavidus]